MTRLSADIDAKVLDEALEVSGCKTKREAIDRALREFVARRRAQELAGLEGKGLVAMSIEELVQWRSESRASKS
jgi:Arc/MetJ family transcription regulator